MELVIGCDINEYYVQFSYAEEGKEPVMPDFPGVTQVETELCRREGVNQWYEGSGKACAGWRRGACRASFFPDASCGYDQAFRQ